jgi:D-amino-acid dehydrogenase
MARIGILGGGVIGLSAAWHCLARGHQVVLVDRNPPLRDGCSFGNAGMIVPSHFIPLAAPGMVALGLKWMWNPESPFWIKPRIDTELFSWGLKFWRAATAARAAAAEPLLRDLNLASRAGFAALEKALKRNFALNQRGLLMLCRTEHGLADESRMAGRARALGIPAEVLDAAQTARKDPGVKMTVAGSVFFPMDAWLHPGRLMEALEAALVDLGAHFVRPADVVRPDVTGSRINAIETTAGRVEADEFVLCTGAWSGELGRAFGLKLPMQAGKGYSLTLERPRQLPSLCAIFTEARVAVTPMAGSLRIGGTMELGGLNEEVDPRRVRGIIKAVPGYYPDFTESDFSGVKPWHGLRPCSPDGLPYLGRTKSCDNLIVAAGHAMMGLSLAPVTGCIVADLASGSTPAFDLSLLDPDRYA